MRVNDPGPVPAAVLGLLGDRSGAQFQVTQRNSGANTFYFSISRLANATYIFSPEAGRTYHFAFAYESASGGGIYKDGILVQPIPASGVLGDPGSNGFWAGIRRRDLQSIATRHDITIDDIALWNGYKLSATDIADLRDRNTTPDTIGGPSLVHWTTLDGTTGNTAAVSETGTTDQSGASTDWTSVGGSPVYVEDLEYIHPAEIASARVGTSGKTVVVQFRSVVTGNPVTLSSVSWPTAERQTVQQGSASNNETQYIKQSGFDGGTFTLTYDGAETPALAHNATAADVQTALEAIPALTGNISCTGGPMGTSQIDIEFTGGLALTDASPIFFGQNNLTTTTHPSIRINGVVQNQWDAPPVYYNDYAIFFLKSTVQTSHTVTLDVGDQRIKATAGFVRGVSNYPVANQVGQTLLTDQPAPGRSMRVGWNVIDIHRWEASCVYADVMKSSARGWNTAGDEQWRILSSGPDSANGKGYENLEPGYYTLTWEGDAPVRLVNPDATGRRITMVSDSFTTTTAGTNGPHVRVYLLEDTPGTYESLIYVMRGITGTVGTSHIRVFPPGIDPNNPPKWHPRFLERLQGAGCVRSMDLFHTNGSNIVYHSDFTPSEYDAAHRNDTYDSAGIRRRIVKNIATIEHYDDVDRYFDSNNRVKMLVTTTTDHGLESGQVVDFSNDVVVTLENGAQKNPYKNTIRVLSPNTFALENYENPPSPVAGVQSPGGTISMEIERGMPVADFIEICNSVGADAWFNVPHAMTDPEVTLLAQEVAGLLDPGLKLYLEYSNEHWNFASAFRQFWYIFGQGQLAGLTKTQWYTKRAGEVHDIFATALAAAGKSDALVRLFGIQPFSNGQTSEILHYASANGIQVDAIAFAPYYRPADPEDFVSTFNEIDIDQIMDISEVTVDNVGPETASLQATIQASPMPDTKLICYEGGMEMGAPSGGTDLLAQKSRIWSVHPRLRGVVLRFFQVLEANGVALFSYYILDTPHRPYYGSGTPRSAVWGAYIGYDQEPGLGDGSDGKFNNLAAPEAFGDVVSVIGQAVRDWNALVTGADPGPGPEVGRHRPARRLPPRMLRPPVAKTGTPGTTTPWPHRPRRRS